jgi:tRNA(Ile)-lysidine synthase
MISGGSDSMALLALVADFAKIVPREVIVHHCHHGVIAASDDWLSFVAAETKRCDCVFKAHWLVLEMGPDFEARARKARYDSVMSDVQSGDVVMTAHHRDDQVETLLIRLSQGSGFIGLAGIPVIRPFGLGLLIRPLLSLSRKQLKQVLVSRNLQHINDPSNQDPAFLRNYIRLRFLPALARIAPQVREQLLLLSKLASDRVFQVGETLGERLPRSGVESVKVAATATLIAWQVRFFAQVHGRFAPSALQIWEFARQCVEAADDRLPEVSIGADLTIRKWANQLYWVDLQTLGDEASEEVEWVGKMEPYKFKEIRFPNGVLSLTTGAASENIAVYWGVQGRSFRLGRKRPKQSLKQLAQAWGIPPWLRHRTPLIAITDQIIGWGHTDCREQSLIPHSLRWKWRFVPRNAECSPVS